MAGTIVADTIQDGAGNSTAMDNAIYGSAKAWVTYSLTTQTILASYNVGSVTYNSTGNFTINFTNALADANYCVTACATSYNPSDINRELMICGSNGSPFQKTASALRMIQGYGSNPGNDVQPACVAVFR